MNETNEPEDRRRFLTVAEVAAMWRVSDTKIRSDIRKGALPAYTVSGSLRIRLRDASAYGSPVSHDAPKALEA